MDTRPAIAQKAKETDSKEKAFKAKAKAQAKDSKEVAGIVESMDTLKATALMGTAKAKEEDGRAKEVGNLKGREKAGATAPLRISGRKIGSRNGSSRAQSK